MASRQEGVTLGPYRIIEQVGLGGMATVYKAYQPSMDRYVALKVLPQHYAKDPEFVERFLREARTIARLEHPNILPVYDFGEENGVTYLAMRYLEGGTLKDVLALGRLSMADAAEILTQIGSALDYAHRQGVAHRDVKPTNIMVDSEGWAYLTDFGIAKVLEGTSELTAGAIGTPAYMAPEQSLGQAIDARTDIYSLGIILYEIVTGRVPYEAETPVAVALAHIHRPLPLPREINPAVPEPIERVILKALAKDPDDRFDSAGEFAEALKAAIAEAGVESAETQLRTLAIEVRDSLIARTEPVTQAAFRDALAREISVPEVQPRKRFPIWAWAIIGAVIVAAAVGGLALMGVLSGGGPAAYDNFDDPAFDGGFDTGLWILRGPCDVAQTDGELRIAFDEPCILEASTELIAGADLESMEARIQVESTENAIADHALIFWTDDIPSGGRWAVHCGLTTTDEGLVANAWINRDDGGRVERFPAEFGAWYDVRLAVDPDTMEMTCMVNDRTIMSFMPERTEILREARFSRGIGVVADPNVSGVMYADDVVLIP
jgi:tRNA A-37 threonylcarbamoyl transferase component Bud32